MTNYQKYPWGGGTGYVVWALRRIGGAAAEQCDCLLRSLHVKPLTGGAV